MFRELCGAILPRLGLSATLRAWNQISERLAEAPRKRMRQSLK
jgi:hypothetical protein